VRQERSASLVRDLRPWLDAQLGRVSQGSALAAAIRYGLRHWEGLCRHLHDGTLDIDSNPVEREIRPICVTRKAALFAGSAGGGAAWAIAATLIRTAVLNGVNPLAWLTEALERMVRGSVRATELAGLLLWNWHQPGAAAAA
jgi:transposase